MEATDMRKWYPIMLDIAGQPCVVVGGGPVGFRRASGLAECGALVTVISPDGVPELAAAAERRELAWCRRRYRAGDLSGARLAFAATGDAAVNAAVREEGKRLGIWVNSADDAEKGDFAVPSVVRRGRLVMAVTTGGAAPLLARRIAAAWREEYGEEYAAYADMLARLRRRILMSGAAAEVKRECLAELAAEEIPRRLRGGEPAEALEAELARRLAERIGAL